MESKQQDSKNHKCLRVVLAVIACIGIYILHGVIMYGILGFTAQDQKGIALPCSIGIMIALMGYTFKAIVYRKTKK